MSLFITIMLVLAVAVVLAAINRGWQWWSDRNFRKSVDARQARLAYDRGAKRGRVAG